MEQVTVIKIGGTLLAEMSSLDPLWQAVRALQEEGPVAMIHGGGAQATAMAERLGHEPRIVQGRRVTTDLDLDIVQWTLRGALNTELVSQALNNGLRAVGLSGVDGGMLRVNRRPPWEIKGEEVDFGWVGDVERVETELLTVLLQSGFIPVLAPLGVDASGSVYNVNADTVARAVAEALQARRFLLVTEAGGVRRDADDAATQLDRCDRETFEEGVAAGWIEGGMRVKLKVAFDAIDAGVSDVFIVNPEGISAPERDGTRVAR